MLEGLLQRLLLHHCSSILEECSAEQVSLWRGALVLRDVRIKKDALHTLFNLTDFQYDPKP